MERRSLALPLLATAWSIFTLASPAAAATRTLNPGDNLTAAVEAAAIGDTIQLNPGTYTPSATPGYPAGSTQFAIVKQVRIVGLGSDPSKVVLSAPSPGANVYAVRFVSYTFVSGGSNGDPSRATLENLTISSGASGVNVTNGTGFRFHDITLKNVVINATTTAGSFGVVLQSVDWIVLENVTVTSSATAFYVKDATDTLLMNSSVVSTSDNSANALAVLGGSRNRIVNNALGTAATAPSTTINGGAVNLYNTQDNRFELNTVQGHRDDGVDLHNTNSSDVPTQQTLDNYVGKNIVISNGYVSGRAHGTSIWVNCSANNSWIFGNDVQGGPEAGLTIFSSSKNVFAANVSHSNEDAGFFVSGAADTFSFCPITGYQVKSNRNYLFGNSAFHNKIDSVIVRTADNTDLVMNYISPKDGFGGASYPCTSPTAPECQSAITLESSVAGARALRNTLDGANRGLWVNDGTITGLEFFGNRVLGSTLNRLIAPSGSQSLDWGSTLGGNFWSQASVAGNPSATPFTDISYNSNNDRNGAVSDRFPFESETFGSTTMSVSEPANGQSYARGSARTVRWYAPACTYVDLSLDGVTTLKALDGVADLATNLANTGYAVVRFPTAAAIGSHTLAVACKNSVGAATGQQASSASFNITDGNLMLLTPGRDDVFSAGQMLWVSFKRASAFSGAVTVDLSTDGGVTYPTQLQPSVTGDFVQVTLPTIASTAYAMIRITSGSAVDTTDGYFAIRGSSGAGFKNVPSGRAFAMGQLERLEWASPQNGRLVTLSYTAGAASGTIATDLPDRGYLDWIVPLIPTSNLILTASFKTSAGTAISSASLASGTASTSYPAQALGVTKSGNGTVTGTGISCGSTCSASYAINTVVTLTATADAGWSFSRWSGACSGTTSTCNVTLDSAKSVTAIFDTGTLVTRYRLYSDFTKEHLYTTDFNEYSVLPVCCNWIAEGAIYRVFQGAGRYSGVSAVPYYRLYNPSSFQHHWTTDAVEYAFLATVGWTQEGVDGYILPSAATGAMPLYRLYLNAAGGLHLWTVDVGEVNFLVANAGWVSEGIAGYVVPLP